MAEYRGAKTSDNETFAILGVVVFFGSQIARWLGSAVTWGAKAVDITDPANPIYAIPKAVVGENIVEHVVQMQPYTVSDPPPFVNYTSPTGLQPSPLDTILTAPYTVADPPPFVDYTQPWGIKPNPVTDFIGWLNPWA